MLTANELGTTKLGEIKGVLTVVITTAFVIEGITFVALFPGLYKVNHGNVRHTLWESLFFAVMAYNNAGFTPDGAGLHVNNWAVGLPIDPDRYPYRTGSAGQPFQRRYQAGHR